MRHVSWKAVLFCLICVFCLSSIAAFAQQQPPKDNPGPPKEGPFAGLAKNPVVWELEARVIAGLLKLPPQPTEQLVTVYKAARQSHLEAMEAKKGQRDPNAIREINEAEKSKLETALKAFLTPDQTTQALATLGTFNHRWDPMIKTINDFKLDDAKKTEAMKLITDFVAASGKLPFNRESRDERRKLREKLDDDMAKVLTPEQLATWKQETAQQRPGFGGMFQNRKPESK